MKPFKIFALLLLVLYPASILWWHHNDTRPSSMDETRHMKLAMDYRDWLVGGVPLTNEWSHVYPPVYHFSIIPALSLGTPTESKAALTHTLYLVIFMLGCILLGRSARRPDWESVLAAALCCGYCYVFWASRRALTDFPLMAWVTFSVALLSRTDGFSDRRAALWWGASAGIGLLLKAPFVFFLFGPVLWTLASSSSAAKFKNVIAAVVLALVIGVPWYFWQGAYFIAKASSLATETTGAGTNPHTLAGWLLYLKWLRMQLGVPSLLFSAAGMILALTRFRTKGNGLLVVWFLSGYVLLSLLVNKDPRHTLAILPALAILAARGWCAAGERWSPRWSPWVLSAAGPLLLVYNMSTYDLPAKEDWKHQAILQRLARAHDPVEHFLSASILSHHPRFFARTITWSAMQEGIPFAQVSTGDENASFAEYVIVRPGDQGTETAVVDEQWKRLSPDTRVFKSLYSTVDQETLPDGSRAIVYRRDPHPDFDVSALTAHNLERRIASALGALVEGRLSVSVQATPEGLREGRMDRVRIACSPCTVKGVVVESLDVTAEKPWLNLYRLWDENRLGLLGAQALKPVIHIRGSDLEEALLKVRGLEEPHVQLGDGRIRVRARFRGWPVAAVARLVLAPAPYTNVSAVLDSVTLGRLRLPGWILGKPHRQILWLYPQPDFPISIRVSDIAMDGGQLTIR